MYFLTKKEKPFPVIPPVLYTKYNLITECDYRQESHQSFAALRLISIHNWYSWVISKHTHVDAEDNT